jgi:chorismate-pyruvate lyase
MLIEREAEIDTRDTLGTTPLHRVVQTDNLLSRQQANHWQASQFVQFLNCLQKLNRLLAI